MTTEVPTQFKHQLALIIPTRNRSELLITLLQTIQTQSVKPAQIIIVDGSDEPIQQKINGYLSKADTYVHIYPPSLTKQRNEGIKQLHGNITLAGYLDDDIELEPDAIEEMLRFWERCPPDVGGAEFNIINTPEKKRFYTAVERLFSLNSAPGKVLRSGISITAHPAKRDLPCEWLCGGATIWKREVLENYKYDEWYLGWATHDDVEFSYRVYKKYRLFVVHRANVFHNPPPVNPEKQRVFFRMSVIGRYYFVKKNPELSVFLFYRAIIHQILLYTFMGFLKRNRQGFYPVQGSLEGLFHVIRGNLIQLDEKYRK